VLEVSTPAELVSGTYAPVSVGVVDVVSVPMLEVSGYWPVVVSVGVVAVSVGVVGASEVSLG
jgi:hypothetical protein